MHAVNSMQYSCSILTSLQLYFLSIVDALYETFHKRTAVPTAVYIVLCATVLTGLLILYRVLDPRESKNNVKTESEEEETLVNK